jgi:predicted peroxiredoxin/TusA-related sulfurtransferase
MTTDLETRTSLDLRGRTITTFIAYKVHDALSGLDEGDRIDVVTDAFTAIDTDLRAWCRVTGNALVDADVTGSTWRFTIEKGAPRRSTRKFAAVIEDDGLFELLAPLGFALAAALEGHDVSLYFQGPAVKVLANGYMAKMHGLGRPFSRLPRAGLDQAGHIPPQAKLRQLQRLGARIYACGPSMDHFKVAETNLAFDDVVVAEYLTFMEQMDQADIHVYS